MQLAELLTLITNAWPDRFERGRVLHVHKNDLDLPDGSTIHLRVLVQRVSDPPEANQ